MNRIAIVVATYSEHFEHCPFSRFTADASEQIANAEWRGRAMRWGDRHVDKNGHWDGELCERIGVSQELKQLSIGSLVSR